MSDPRVERLPPGEVPLDEFDRAEAETRHMMQSAAREMERDFAHAPADPGADLDAGAWSDEAERAPVLDVDPATVTRVDELERSIEALKAKALDAERLDKLETRVNVLTGLAVALLLLTLYLAFR